MWHTFRGGGPRFVTVCDRGEGGGQKSSKKRDILYGRPLVEKPIDKSFCFVHAFIRSYIRSNVWYKCIFIFYDDFKFSFLPGTSISKICDQMFWTAGQRLTPNERSNTRFVWKPDNMNWSEMHTTFWTQGEPNNYENRNEACANVYMRDFRWNDGLCSALFCPLCEVDMHWQCNPTIFYIATEKYFI